MEIVPQGHKDKETFKRPKRPVSFRTISIPGIFLAKLSERECTGECGETVVIHTAVDEEVAGRVARLVPVRLRNHTVNNNSGTCVLLCMVCCVMAAPRELIAIHNSFFRLFFLGRAGQTPPTDGENNSDSDSGTSQAAAPT